jgi:hypothetical protein
MGEMNSGKILGLYRQICIIMNNQEAALVRSQASE